jgi:alpha-L-fucosidase
LHFLIFLKVKESIKFSQNFSTMKNKSPFTLLFFFAITMQLQAQNKYQSTWESIDSRPVPTWFTDAKFGIFIHWGLYSVPSWAPTGGNIPVYSKYAEWYWYRMCSPDSIGLMFKNHHDQTYGSSFQYQDFAKDFRAEMFNPGEWANLIAASGAKYVVLTSKHHDGFTLWPSPQSWNWNSMDTGPHKDIAGELGKKIKEKGLRMGYYYSLYEWFNPLYKNDLGKYVDDHMILQMKDLITNYQPDIFWTDGEWEHPSKTWKSTDFLSWLYNESPVKENVVVNDRWGSETRSKHGGIYTTEFDLVFDNNTQGKNIAHPWEECRGIGGSFGYNRAEKLEDYATSEQLIHTLIEKVARGGNLLLDIGPTADGRIPVIMQQRLMDIGRWLKINGEAIYKTQTWLNAPPVNHNTTLFFTRNERDLYAIVTNLNQRKIIIDNIRARKNIQLLGYKEKIRSTLKNNKLIIELPTINSENNTSYAWVFKIEDTL